MPGAAKNPPQEFPTTWWTLVGQALADGTTVRTAALAELVLRYRPPLRAHLLLRKRLDEELADELLQGFIVDKILEQYLLRRADREKGKFRSLLVRSLENYFVDWVRDRRNRPVTGAENMWEEAAANQEFGVDPFDIAWARQLLTEAIDTMKSDCEANAQANVWGVFEHRLLAPMREGTAPMPYTDVCARYGFNSPEDASNALVTAKRKFQRAFERVAVGYRHDGEPAEYVLQELIEIVSRAGGLEWRETSRLCDAAQPVTGSSRALVDLQPALVARFLETQPDADSLWLADDLLGMMRHQLAQRLTDLELKGFGAKRYAESGGTDGPLATLGDVFRHPAPGVELLEAIKRYGRKRVHRPDESLPGEIASAVYFASIAAALVRHGQRITTSDNDFLRWGFERLLSQPWIEAPLGELFVAAVVCLGPGDSEP